MTLFINSPYEFHHKINVITIILILIGCFGAGVALSTIYRSTIFTVPLFSEEVAPIPAIDLGNVNGLVTSSDGLPISGASVHVFLFQTYGFSKFSR